MKLNPVELYLRSALLVAESAIPVLDSDFLPVYRGLIFTNNGTRRSSGVN